MNNEEFYKNKLISLINDLCEKLNLRSYASLIYLDGSIEAVEENGRLIDLKRNLIIKEKTWYKTGNNDCVYIYGSIPEFLRNEYLIWPFSGAIFASFDDNKFFHSTTYTISGKCSSPREEWNIIRECTSEEAEEIEKSLRKTKNEKPS